MEEKHFKPKEANQKIFIPMPPPNITGILHIGHAIFLSIQDSLTRYYRKSGKQTLWLPGTDHAGLATDRKIRESFGNRIPSDEEYLERGAELKEKFQTRIIEQIKSTGASCDWDRLSYTLDKKFQIAALRALKEIDKAGLLYKKKETGQWCISMKSMADDLLRSIKAGEFTINDTSELNKLIPMLEDIRDWEISRGIMWGYQMPIYCNENKEYLITEDEAEAREKLGNTAKREGFSFDTWFTSALWPMATLGWPEKTKDFQDYYPASLIETGADILFFWCAKMLMMGKFLTGEYPFKEILLHGICRDKKGQKMSKSLGNGIDPLEIIDKYGADALRWGLLSQTTHKDLKLNENDFNASSKFINKIWQSAKFFNFNLQNFKEKELPSLEKIKGMSGGAFEEEIAKQEKDFASHMENRRFLEATKSLQYSFKHKFCDEWIEQNKIELKNGNLETLEMGLSIFYRYLNLLNCFIPFITEKIADEFWGISLIESHYCK